MYHLRTFYPNYYAIILFVLVVFGVCANAAALKQIQTYPEQDKLDVLLLLDSTFDGDIGTTNIHNQKMTMISHITSSTKWSKTFSTSPIKKLEIIPQHNNLYFNIESRKQYYIKPSISKDKNTLRLSFFSADSGIMDSLIKTPTTLKPTPINEVFQNTSTNLSKTVLESTPTESIPTESTSTESNAPKPSLKDSLSTQDIDMGRYWYMLIGFVVILIALLYIRKQVRKSSGLNESLNIVSQSQIDPKNKIIIIEAKEYFYMVLLGDKGNVLLDKIPKKASHDSRSAQPHISQKISDGKAFDEKFWSTLNNTR